MNTFKRKSLYAALGGLVAAGAAGTANAVYVNNEGLGEALIYPYYTVRNGTDTLISVVNSTASAKAVKVRFLEAKNSKEVLDFNLYLSPYDVWTAAVTNTASGAAMVTSDRSCTTPTIAPGTQVPFRNGLFNLVPEGDVSLDRTREGYVEIIEMGVLTNPTLIASVTHNPTTGVPACTGLPTTIAPALDQPRGGMFGGGTLINVANGTDYSYDAVALAEWSDVPRYAAPGSVNPTLAQASPNSALVVSNQSAVNAVFATGADAVSAAMMHDRIYNEYVSDPNIRGGTDWVITFPTKRFYVSEGSGTALRPFQRNYANNSGACDDIGLAYYDREERQPGSTVDFSPSPAPTGPQLCYEANVVTFNNANVLASALSRNIATTDPVTGLTYPAGWAVIDLAANAAHELPSLAGLVIDLNTGASAPGVVTFAGLPSLGFAVQQYTNNRVGTPPVLSNYGGTFVHKATRFFFED